MQKNKIYKNIYKITLYNKIMIFNLKQKQYSE